MLLNPATRGGGRDEKVRSAARLLPPGPGAEQGGSIPERRSLRAGTRPSGGHRPPERSPAGSGPGPRPHSGGSAARPAPLPRLAPLQPAAPAQQHRRGPSPGRTGAAPRGSAVSRQRRPGTRTAARKHRPAPPRPAALREHRTHRTHRVYRRCAVPRPAAPRAEAACWGPAARGRPRRPPGQNVPLRAAVPRERSCQRGAAAATSPHLCLPYSAPSTPGRSAPSPAPQLSFGRSPIHRSCNTKVAAGAARFSFSREREPGSGAGAVLPP